jgi:hypothetical protein
MARKRKKPNNYGFWKKAFDGVIGMYRRPAQALAFLDLKVDVDRIVRSIVKPDALPWFWAAYSYDSDDPVEKEIFAQTMLGNRRHLWELKAGRTFIETGLFPLRKYLIGYPPMIRGLSECRETGMVLSPSISDIPNALGTEVTEKSEDWMAACHKEHSHSNEYIFAPEDDYEGLAPQPGYVYAMSDPDKLNQIKIGKAKDPEERLKSLRTACPDIAILFTLFVKDMDGDEDYYHRRFAADRRGTSEWFYLSTELQKWVDSEGRIDIFEDDGIKEEIEQVQDALS